MAPRRLSVTNGTSIISVLTNTRQPLAVPLETVADSLAQCSGPSRLITMLAPTGGVLGVIRQCSEHLLVEVGKPHSCYHHVLAVLLGQTVRQPQPQPQGQRAIIANSGRGRLVKCGFTVFEKPPK